MEHQGKDQKLFDLSILYVDDGKDWCEFLCEHFKSAYDLTLYWENITHLPLNENAARNVRASKAQMVIVTPYYVNISVPLIDDVLDNPIAFLCGIEEESEEAKELQSKVESFLTWQVVSATNDMKEIISQTFMVIDQVSDTNDILDTSLRMGEEEKDEVYIIPERDSDMPILSQPKDLAKQLEKDGMIVQPNKAICGIPEMLIIMFKAALLTDHSARYVVKFRGQQEVDVDGIRLNDFALTVRFPQEQPPCAGTVSVQKAGSLSSLGECDFEFLDNLDVLANILETNVNPKELLCQALKISSGDIRGLDSILTASYKRSVPASDMEKLSPLKHEVQAVAKTREIPTLIHFAAKFGLQELASLLLNSPGALMAFEVVNCNGDYPNDIARNEGHTALADYLENFVECGALLEDIMVYREIYAQIPEYEGEKPEELYLDMSANIPYYNTAHQFKGYREGMYDTPFPVPISANVSDVLFKVDHDDPIYTIEGDKLKEVIQEGTLDTIYDELPESWKARSPEDYYDDDKVYQNPDEMPDKPFKPVGFPRRLPTIPRTPAEETAASSSLEQSNKEEAPVGPPPSVIPGLSDAQMELINIQRQVKENKLTIDEAVQLFKQGNKEEAPVGPPPPAIPGLSVAQMELINIQRQVKEKKLTIDEAVQLFNAFKLDKLGKSENFYSYQTQTEFIYATKKSLKEKKKEMEMSLAKSLTPSSPEETTGKAGWNELHRKMTCKPGRQREQVKRRAAKPPPQSAEETWQPFIRSDRLSTSSTSSSISSRNSRGSSIRSVDSSYGSHGEDEQSKESVEKPKEKPQTQRLAHRRSDPRRKKRPAPEPALEKRLSQHIEFSDVYLNKEMPPLPPRTHLDPHPQGRIVRDPPPPTPEDDKFPLAPPPPPPISYVDDKAPRPDPQQTYCANNPLPAPPEEELDDTYSLQREPVTTQSPRSEDVQKQQAKKWQPPAGLVPVSAAMRAELEKKLHKGTGGDSATSSPAQPVAPDDSQTYDDAETTKPQNLPPKPSNKPKPRPRPRQPRPT